MKILTWNINGVRAVQKDKTNLKTILDSLGADVVCLQETKVTRDMLDEPTAVVDGYESYFSFSRKKSGYSGTANYCKTDSIPVKAEEGLSGKLTTPNDSCVYHYGNVNSFSDEELHALDEEGRCVITQHRIRLPTGEEKEMAIINVYVPRAGDREDRHVYKLQFLTLLQIRAEALLKNDVHVIILGDINATHRQIDNCDPDEEFFRKSSRIWLNQLLQQKERDKDLPATDANLSDIIPTSCQLQGGNFSDVFRQLHPLQEKAFTNWCTLTGARQTNFGRRLDYVLVDTELAKFATHCDIMSEVEGSDHCPVIVTLNCSSISSSQSPLLCSKFMPEFKGQQKKLSSFFTKVSKLSQSPKKNITSHREDRGSNPDLETEVHSSSSPPVSSSQKSETFTGLKRHWTTGVDSLSPSSNKKTKLKKKNSSSDSKQISLTSFFSQKNNNINKKSNSSINNKCHMSPTKSDNNNIDNITNVSPVKTNRVPVVDCLVVIDDDDDIEHKLTPPKETSSGCNRITECETEATDSSLPLTEGKTDMKKKPSIFDEEKVENSTLESNPVKPFQNRKSQASAWKGLLGGLPPPPVCPGHKEACVLRTVKKAGPNQNKQFYVCARPDGASGNPESRCDFFQWLMKKK